MTYKLEVVGDIVGGYMNLTPNASKLLWVMCRTSQDYREGMHGGISRPAVCSASRETLAKLVLGRKKSGEKADPKDLDRPIAELKRKGLIKPLIDKVGFGSRQEFQILIAEILADNEFLVQLIREDYGTMPKYMNYVKEVLDRGKEGASYR